MNDQELKRRVQSSMYAQCKQRGYAAPVDVLMDIGALDKKKYEDWRFGRVPYLERVCTMNLSKLSTAMHEMRSYAAKHGLKSSFTFYKRWGAKHTIPLRFSKSGRESIERAYATHFVGRLQGEAADRAGKPEKSAPGKTPAGRQASARKKQPGGTQGTRPGTGRRTNLPGDEEFFGTLEFWEEAGDEDDIGELPF